MQGPQDASPAGAWGWMCRETARVSCPFKHLEEDHWRLQTAWRTWEKSVRRTENVACEKGGN